MDIGDLVTVHPEAEENKRFVKREGRIVTALKFEDDEAEKGNMYTVLLHDGQRLDVFEHELDVVPFFIFPDGTTEKDLPPDSDEAKMAAASKEQLAAWGINKVVWADEAEKS